MKNLYTLLFLLLIFSACQSPEKETVTEEIIPPVEVEAPVEIIETDTLQAVLPEPEEPEWHEEEFSSFIKSSNPFEVNSMECYWEFELIVFEDEPGGTGIVKLLDYSTKEILLEDEDYYGPEVFENLSEEEFDFGGQFRDVNFDGFDDFTIHNRIGSGSGGSVSNVYLFDKENKAFKFSEELTGGELEVNEEEKTLSTHWKTGVAWNARQIVHFDKERSGKILFKEIITREVIPGDSTDLLKTTYEKKIDDKVVQTAIDTTEFYGY